MSRINWRRVLLGGLLAGVIINVFEIVWSGMVLGKQWQAAMNALGHELPSAALWIFPLEVRCGPEYGGAVGLGLLGDRLRAANGWNWANGTIPGEVTRNYTSGRTGGDYRCECGGSMGL